MKKIIYTVVVLLALAACQKDEDMIRVEDDQSGTSFAPEAIFLEGHIRIKFKTEVATRVNVVKTKSGISSGLSAVDLVGVDLSVYRMERVFPPAGKFEERHREAELHLWYDVFFDEKIPTRSAAIAYEKLPEVEIVSLIPEVRICDYKETEQPLASWYKNEATTTRSTEEMPFNDPRLSEMWHYNNMGESVNNLMGALPGADIGLFEAWKTETGSKDVIVAVMDGGIQSNHPDLAANMWVNEAELNGQAGVDDDGNGYVDDIYGWNFVTAQQASDGSAQEKGEVTQYVHGTHCAGTISGVTGNGVGISGIAGGTGKGDGVRLMSCQIFHIDPATGEDKNYANPNMYIYAADMGAVISSNSWTSGAYEEAAFLNSPMRSAIDYFIKYAGKDVSTKQQNGPMEGGLVIFAAANSNSDAKEWPCAYSEVLAVASMSHNFKRSSYSNFGTWVDITAPGGEQSYGDAYAILSTSINGGYAWLQGTSMACPHLSGCAALVLSKFQGKGYTPNELSDRLLNATHNIDGYNQKFKGLLGAGCIDVGLALTPPSTDPPVSSDLHIVDAYDSWAIVQWEVKNAPDGPMNKYVISWSDTADDLPLDAAAEHTKTVNVRYVTAGTMLRDTIKNLELDKTYYFTIQAYDRWGGISDPAPIVNKTVIENQAPVLTATWQGIVMLNEGSERTIVLKVTDPEKQKVTCVAKPMLDWMKTVNMNDTAIYLQLTPHYKAAGNYKVQIEIVDQYGKTASIELPIEVVYKDVAPQQIKLFTKLQLTNTGNRTTLNLADYFIDLKGHSLMYEIENSSSAIATVQRNGNHLIIEPKFVGNTQVLVRAKNESGLSVSQRFNVEVIAGNENVTIEPLTVFPNPVRKELNIALIPSKRGAVTLKLYNSVGRLMLMEQVTIRDNGYMIDMGKMQAGTYVLEVIGETGVLKKNIIKI